MVHQVTLRGDIETAGPGAQDVCPEAAPARLVATATQGTDAGGRSGLRLRRHLLECSRGQDKSGGKVTKIGMLRRGVKHLSRVNDVLFRRLRIERDITIFPDDMFLTSYPRSGNTWTRFLVGNLVHTEEAVTFLNVERLVADMYKHGD